jgi:2Fe-2S ferredoxin
MVMIKLIEASGAAHVIDAKPGRSLMENAVKNGVAGIAADCGGMCACATCRVYVGAEWRENMREPSRGEREMLEYSGDTREDARLSCQIEISDDLEGLTVTMPESQRS